MKLPRKTCGVDLIWVIVDIVNKSDHFIQIQESSFVEKFVEIYIKEVVARYGIPVSLVSDRDVCFTSRFWRKFQMEFGIRLNFSITYHP